MTGAVLSDADVGLGVPAASAAPQGLLSDEDVGLGGSANATKPVATDEASPKPTPSVLSDVAKGAASGVAQGVYGLVGLPGDIGRAADYGSLWLQGAAGHALGLTDKSASDYAKSQVAALDQARGGLKPLPTTEDVQAGAKKIGVPDYQPQSIPGQYARTIGEFLPGAVATPGRGLVGNAVKYGLVPGAMSETAGQLTQGTAAEPYARTIAGLAGGLGADAATGVAKGTADLARQWWEPATAVGPENIAARQFRSAFHDPELAQAQLQEGADAAKPGQAIGENVPDSKPTTGQYTGDLGALSLERGIATQRPDLAHTNVEGTGLDQQNAARTSALQAIQPTGAPEEIGNTVRQQMAKLQADEDAKVATATEAAQKASEGAVSSAEGVSKTVGADVAAQTEAARQAAQAQAGGIGVGATPESLGASARAAAQKALDATKEQESGLWKAVDPDGKLAAVATPISDSSSSIAEKIRSTAKPMGPEEAAIFDTAASLPDVAPFQDITELRSRISDEMRQVIGKNPRAFSRLSQLRGAVEDTIKNAVENQAAYEAQIGVAPEQSMAARVQRWVDDFKAAKGKSAPAAAEALTPNLDDAAAARLKAASAATQQRVKTFDKGPVGVALKKADTADNYRIMDSAVPDLLFRPGPKGAQTVQAYLKAAGPAGSPRLANIAAESLRRAAIKDGVVDPKAYAEWAAQHQDALRAMPDEMNARFSNAARATETLRDLEAKRGLLVDPLQGAVESLSREVMQDGAIDPKKFDRWQKRHDDTLQQMPQNVRDQLSTAAKASEAVAEAAAKRKEAIDGYQKSVAGKFLGLDNPTDVTKNVAGLLDSKNAVASMTALAKRVAADPDAKEGLRKAVMDTLLARATSTQEAGASGVKALNASTFQKLVRDKHAAIKAAGFSDQEMNVMRAVADDMERSQRTMSATKLPNSPGTAQDVIKFMDRAKATSSGHGLSLLAKVLGGGYLGFEHGGLHGALLGALAGGAEGVSEKLLQARRNAGLQKASDLISEAVRKPELALALLKKAPVGVDRGSEYTLRKMLIRNAMFGAMTTDRERNHQTAESL